MEDSDLFNDYSVLQRQAAEAQKRADTLYAIKLAEFNQAIPAWKRIAEAAYFADRPIPPPPQPPTKMLYVVVAGTVHETPWTDPALSPPTFTPPPTGSPTEGKLAAPAEDVLDLLKRQNAALYRQGQALAAAVANLNAKLDLLLQQPGVKA